MAPQKYGKGTNKYMTNAEYIMSRLTDQTLAMLFTGMYNYCETCNHGFGYEVKSAFRKWRASTYHANRNYFSSNDSEKERPSVFEWSKVCKDEKWGSFGYRTDSVAFQVWLSMQYNCEEWNRME